MNRMLTLAVLAALSPAAFADTEWTPRAEFGLVHATGNADTTSVNGKFGLAGEDEFWTHDYRLAGLRAESDDEISANRWEVAAKTARKLTERTYLGGAARYENDDFSAYSDQATLALNYGWWAIKNDDTTFQLEGGPGIRRAELADTGEREQDAMLRGFADYQHQFTDNAKFFNTLLVEAGPDNTFLQNEIGISVAINRSLALKAALEARHNTEAPAGLERTDTLTSINIVWAPKRAE